MVQFFDRYVEVSIGDLVITSDDLDIEFNIKNSTGDEAGSAAIVIYNLAEATRQLFEADALVIIKAGYREDFGIVFSGTVKEAEDETDGSDVATKVFCHDETTNTLAVKPNLRYPGGTLYEAIVRSLFFNANIPVGRIEPTSLSIDAEWNLGPEMTVAQALERIRADVEEKSGINYNNYVKNGAGYFVRADTLYEEAFVLSSETGLIDVQKMDTDDDEADYKVKSLMLWKVSPDTLLDIDSVKVQGQFRVVDYEKAANEDDYTVVMEVKAA